MCCIMGYAGHDLPKETFTEYLLRTTSRGPDDQRVAETEFGLLGFGRLAIMGLTPEGMQPFFRGADCVACNGELYGFRPVKAELEAEGYTFESDSDCEIILPLYYKYGLDEGQHLYAKQGGKYGHKKEFAIGDERKKREAQAMTRFPDFWMVSFLAKMPALIPPMIPPTVRAPWA